MHASSFTHAQGSAGDDAAIRTKQVSAVKARALLREEEESVEKRLLNLKNTTRFKLRITRNAAK